MLDVRHVRLALVHVEKHTFLERGLHNPSSVICSSSRSLLWFSAPLFKRYTRFISGRSHPCSGARCRLPTIRWLARVRSPHWSHIQASRPFQVTFFTSFSGISAVGSCPSGCTCKQGCLGDTPRSAAGAREVSRWAYRAATALCRRVAPHHVQGVLQTECRTRNWWRGPRRSPASSGKFLGLRLCQDEGGLLPKGQAVVIITGASGAVLPEASGPLVRLVHGLSKEFPGRLLSTFGKLIEQSVKTLILCLWSSVKLPCFNKSCPSR